MKINSTDSVETNIVKMLLTGPSGSGKTYSIRSLKESGFKPLVLSFEAGLLPLHGYGIDFIDGTRDDNDKIIPKEKRSIRLDRMLEYIKTDDCRKKYDTIVLDSLTEISECLFDSLSYGNDKKDSYSIYRELLKASSSAIKSFRDSGYHVVCTCLTSIEKDESGKRFVGLDMIGSISGKAAQFFDIVSYIKVNPDGKREFVCHQTDQIFAKDRSGKLLNTEKSIGDIFTKITKGNK